MIPSHFDMSQLDFPCETATLDMVIIILTDKNPLVSVMEYNSLLILYDPI